MLVASVKHSGTRWVLRHFCSSFENCTLGDDDVRGKPIAFAHFRDRTMPQILAWHGPVIVPVRDPLLTLIGHLNRGSTVEAAIEQWRNLLSAVPRLRCYLLPMINRGIPSDTCDDKTGLRERYYAADKTALVPLCAALAPIESPARELLQGLGFRGLMWWRDG